MAGYPQQCGKGLRFSTMEGCFKVDKNPQKEKSVTQRPLPKVRLPKTPVQSVLRSKTTDSSSEREQDEGLGPATVSRRIAHGSLAAGLAAALSGSFLAANTNADEPKKEGKKEKPVSADRKAVLAAGMTEAEADCWQKVAEAAGAFFKLPELHPRDNPEVEQAIHVIQNKLLSRPTYRAYLAAHKKNAAQKKADAR